MSEPTAYPLAWPAGWPRTQSRVNGLYKTSLAGALKNLRDEVRLLASVKAAADLVLSSNCTLGSENPRDPGVVAYFMLDGVQVAIPCDRWARVEQNVQAIALTIESMRAIQRHGAKHMIKAMFQGFTALPAPDDWRGVLGNAATRDEAKAAYLKGMKECGGAGDRAVALNAAWENAQRFFAGLDTP